MCSGEGGCNKDEGGDKGGRGHKMLVMERVNVRWRRERGGQMLVVESLHAKRVRRRKNQNLCGGTGACKKVEGEEEEEDKCSWCKER